MLVPRSKFIYFFAICKEEKLLKYEGLRIKCDTARECSCENKITFNKIRNRKSGKGYLTVNQRRRGTK